MILIEFIDVSDNKDSMQFCIKSDVDTEMMFIVDFVSLLKSTMDKLMCDGAGGKTLSDGNTLVQYTDIDFVYLMSKFADIVCKHRGYKADVHEKKMYVSNGCVSNFPADFRLNDVGEFEYLNYKTDDKKTTLHTKRPNS